jgi:hypothetical protein
MTTVTVGEIARDEFAALTDAHPHLAEAVWDGFTARAFDNHIRRLPRYASLGRDERLAWLAEGSAQQLDEGQQQLVAAAELAFLAMGSVTTDGGLQVAAPALLGGEETLIADEPTRLILLPRPTGAQPLARPTTDHAA